LKRLFTLDALSSDEVTAMGERLNLWAAKTEVELHGGKLAAYPLHNEPSAPGAAAAGDGVVFVVELPMSRPAMGDTPPTVRSEVVAPPTDRPGDGAHGDAAVPPADDDDGDRESIVHIPAFTHRVVMPRLSNSEGGCYGASIIVLPRSPHA